jgi:hypothetical protein
MLKAINHYILLFAHIKKKSNGNEAGKRVLKGEKKLSHDRDYI